MSSDPRRLAALIETQTAMAAAGFDVGGLLTAAAAHARALTGAEGSVVELLDDEKRVTRAAADSAIVQVGLNVDPDTVAGRALQERRLVGTEEGGRVSVASPLLAGDRIIGVMTVITARPEGFEDGDRDTIRRLTSFVSHLIHHAQRFEETERTSRRDPLTGLGNRRALEETLNIELARHARYGRILSLCLLDLDDFKIINDTFGHQAGDRVLVRVAERLTEIRGADSAFRLGGDEFAVVLPETAGDEAELVARRLVRRIRDDTFPNEVSASWGIAQAAGVDAERLVAEADTELYARKRGERGTSTSSTSGPREGPREAPGPREATGTG